MSPTSRPCPECHVAILRDHHEFPDRYLKCSICGYTEEKPPKPKPPYIKD